MDADRERLLAVLLAVLAAVGGTATWVTCSRSRQPHLAGVSVVFQADCEETASDRERGFPPGSRVRAAAVLEVRRGSGPPRLLCALAPVELEGERVEVEPPAAWPESAGALRATWFTVEPSLPGGEGIDGASARLLEYRDFLAPELGQELVADVRLEAHNDDVLSVPLPGNRLGGGPIRLRVRVGAYAEPDDLVARESVASVGEGDVIGGEVPTVTVTASLPAGVGAHVSAYLRLGCFTFAPGVWPGGGVCWPLSSTPAELVRRAIVVTPQALAAAAACGDPLAAPWGEPVPLHPSAGAWLRDRRGTPLHWGVDASAADAVRAGKRWAVLLEDDGDGVLSSGDGVLFAWRRPAEVATLGEALAGASETPLLLRRVRQ